ncbi:MAG TPA: NUDIX domain-containing protein [Nitrosospira sp.]|jgi:hypothetical protein|nr:NUDIX domain-containing protein [Nitrosospira sp.]
MPNPNHLNPELTKAIRANAVGLPLYGEGPGVDYTHSPVAYATNVTVLDAATMGYNEATGLYVPTDETEALIVQRGSGDGRIGAWSGVSGYIDTMSDPTGELTDDEFDPVQFTARTELAEECGFTPQMLARVALCMGESFPVQRPPRIIHILPFAGVYIGDSKPPIQVDGVELLDAAWVPLGQIRERKGIGSGYVRDTLPAALRALRFE